MRYGFELAKYNGRWAVFCKAARIFIYDGKGKKFCEQKVKELNSKRL